MQSLEEFSLQKVLISANSMYVGYLYVTKIINKCIKKQGRQNRALWDSRKNFERFEIMPKIVPKINGWLGSCETN